MHTMHTKHTKHTKHTTAHDGRVQGVEHGVEHDVQGVEHDAVVCTDGRVGIASSRGMWWKRVPSLLTPILHRRYQR